MKITFREMCTIANIAYAENKKQINGNWNMSGWNVKVIHTST